MFGESLFNDGVTIVLYNTMITLLDIESVSPEDVVMATLSFFTVVFGGALIGFLHGLLVSFTTTFTRDVRQGEILQKMEKLLIYFEFKLPTSYFTKIFLHGVRVVEPLIIFSTAYSAFLFAELFHW